MAIPRFQLSPRRNLIAFFGEMPDSASEQFSTRGYTCLAIPSLTLPGDIWFWSVDSVIVTQDRAQPSRAMTFLKSYAHLLLAADCRIYFRCATQDGELTRLQMRKMIIETIDSLRLPTIGLSKEDRKQLGDWDGERDLPELTPYVDIREDTEDWATLANRIAVNPAGAPPVASLKKPRVTNARKRPVKLKAEQDVLLRRAFSDCRRIEMQELGHGKSDTKAYKGYAELGQTQTGGSWPYQYFIKIGRRAIIAKEYLNYCDTVLDHIPFHLGPRLREGRCVLGSQYGIMVSDYVSNAEALSSKAKSAQAGAAIGNLFTHTLSAWRNGDSPEEFNLKNRLIELFPKKIPRHRLRSIKALGHEPQLKSLRAKLEGYSSVETIVGVIHGDMHAKNILVRGYDAILIDYEKLEKRSPVLQDIAALEAGLLDECFFNDHRSASELLTFLEPLYRAKAFQTNHLKIAPTVPGYWYFQDVHLIRMHAKVFERDGPQYAWMLAVIMLKKACNSGNLNKIRKEWGEKVTGLSPEDVRAVMYVLATTLLNSLSASEASQSL